MTVDLEDRSNDENISLKKVKKSHLNSSDSGSGHSLTASTNTLAKPTSTATNSLKPTSNATNAFTPNSKVKILFSSMLNQENNSIADSDANALNQLSNPSTLSPQENNSFFIPVASSTADLNLLLNSVLKARDLEDEEDGQQEYNFYVDDQLIIKSLQNVIESSSASSTSSTGIGTESTIIIKYIPKSVFKVRSVNRCSSTMTGHSQPVLAIAYSPNGRMLASGSGDNTVRLWDLATETPRACLAGHTGWVQHVAWSPDCAYICSAGMDGKIGVWESKKGTLVGFIKAHTQPITSLTFEPFHLNSSASRLVSTSKDGTAKVWHIHHRSSPVSILSGHTAPVTCSVWSGSGVIYTGSRDKSIKKWAEERNGSGFVWKGEMKGHGHWVNRLAVQSDFICRTGPFDHTDPVFSDNESAHQAALARYKSFCKQHISHNTGELLASCSDDFTIILWPTAMQNSATSSTTTKPLNRMTGHQQAVNSLCFSPDGGVLASASFDKCVKLWRVHGPTPGAFLETLRAHVGAVYQVSFSSDARKLASASRDSTVKVWDVEACLSQPATKSVGSASKTKGKKMVAELNGHEDEVWCVEWAPDGSGLCSGGKDKCLKVWKH